MNQKIVAFDVDGTLIKEGKPNYDVVFMALMFYQNPTIDLVIWSGGGTDYARMWADRLGLEDAKIMRKEKNLEVDIAFDDEEVDLGKANIKI